MRAWHATTTTTTTTTALQWHLLLVKGQQKLHMTTFLYHGVALSPL